MMVFGFILFFIGVIINAYLDYEVWLDGKEINHTKRFFLKGIMLLPSFILLLQVFSFWRVLFFICSWFWFLFDGIYNMLRKYDWWYIGTIDANESKFDNLQRWLGELRKTVKIVLLIASLIFLIFKNGL